MGDEWEIVTDDRRTKPALVLPSFTLAAWQRLRHVCQVVKQTEASVARLRNEFEAAPETERRNQDMAWTIQCTRIALRQYANRVELGKARLRTVTMKLCEVYAEQERRDKERIRFREETRKDEEAIVAREVALQAINARLANGTVQLARRRRQMLANLASIYEIQLTSDCSSTTSAASTDKQRCNCRKFEMITQLHLPRADVLAVSSSHHSEAEIAAALGHVAQCLSLLSCIVDLPLRYPIAFYGSHSTIVDLAARPQASTSDVGFGERYPLYLRGRNREFFQYGVRLINRNLEQLRSDCGLRTGNLDATLANLRDLMHTLTRVTKSSEIAFERPTTCALSLSSMLRTEDGVYSPRPPSSVDRGASSLFFASGGRGDANGQRAQRRIANLQPLTIPSSLSKVADLASSYCNANDDDDDGVSTMHSAISSSPIATSDS